MTKSILLSDFNRNRINITLNGTKFIFVPFFISIFLLNGTNKWHVIHFCAICLYQILINDPIKWLRSRPMPVSFICLINFLNSGTRVDAILVDSMASPNCTFLCGSLPSIITDL